VAKAFGAGADFVMLGGMLAGHAEGGGDDVVIDGNHFRQFYGMSSDVAMEKYSGGVAGYRASEGKSTHVPYRGAVKDTVQQILGGIRSSCTYVGMFVSQSPHVQKMCNNLARCQIFERNQQANHFHSSYRSAQRNFFRQPQSPTAAR
jgi:IMP dehydrogenase/GMP reductase